MLISVLVCNQVDRILQNKLDGKPGERTPGFCFDAQPSKLFNQAGKITDVAADAVQTIDHDGTDLPLFGSGHHLFEVRAVQVAAGKAFILKDDRLLCCGIAVVGADIFASEVDLISDALALAGVAGLAGINCNGVGSFGHEILLSCCPVAVDAAIVAWQAIFVKKNNDSHTYFIILRTEVSRM